MSTETAAETAVITSHGLPSGLRLAATMVGRVLPAVRQDLARWSAAAARCPDPVLRAQSLASIEAKRFHCQGGAALGLLAGSRWREAVRFIVALQTISDYLDNLCDRAGQHDVDALRLLHHAMVEAVGGRQLSTAGDAARGYYAGYPHADDGGYLAALVAECSQLVREWAVPPTVVATGVRLVSLYGEMQARKHGPPDTRVPALMDWHRDCWACPELLWNEFGAACGSTLAVFALYSWAAGGRGVARDSGDGAAQLLDIYFPTICGLHILLDYLIDRREDEATGDLNFTAHYRSEGEMRERLRGFVRRAAAAAEGLPDGRFHRSVVDGLLGVYLSDPKAIRGREECLVHELLQAAGPGARAMHAVCRGLRWIRAV